MILFAQTAELKRLMRFLEPLCVFLSSFLSEQASGAPSRDRREGEDVDRDDGEPFGYLFIAIFYF